MECNYIYEVRVSAATSELNDIENFFDEFGRMLDQGKDRDGEFEIKGIEGKVERTDVIGDSVFAVIYTNLNIDFLFASLSSFRNEAYSVRVYRFNNEDLTMTAFRFFDGDQLEDDVTLTVEDFSECDSFNFDKEKHNTLFKVEAVHRCSHKVVGFW